MQVFRNKEKLGKITKTGNTTVQLSSSIVTIGAKQYMLDSLDCDLTQSGPGGIDIGSVTDNTWYYLYLIDNNGAIDVIASKNSSHPVGHVLQKKIGALYTNWSSEIFEVLQLGGTTSIITHINKNAFSSMGTFTGFFNYPDWKAQPRAVALKGDFAFSSSDNMAFAPLTPIAGRYEIDFNLSFNPSETSASSPYPQTSMSIARTSEDTSVILEHNELNNSHIAMVRNTASATIAINGHLSTKEIFDLQAEKNMLAPYFVANESGSDSLQMLNGSLTVKCIDPQIDWKQY